MSLLRQFLLAAPLVLAACSNISGGKGVTDYLTPYRIDVRQGNFVSQEMASQLKPGMTKDQVRYLLGTPLIADPFHSDRWDYLYRFQPGKGEAEQRKLSIFFEAGKLVRVGGDVAGQDLGQAPDAAALTANTRIIEIAADPNAPKAEPTSSKRWYWPF